MHNLINNIIDDSYEKLLFDEMTIEYSEEGGWSDYSELLSTAIAQLKESDKKKVIVIKVGEMFDVIVVNEITKELQKNFPDKEFILLVNDNQEVDIEFTFINALPGWPMVLRHAYDHSGENIEKFKDINNNHIRKKLFNSRTSLPKTHRLEWIEFLEKNNLKDRGYVSEGWNGIYIEGVKSVRIEYEGGSYHARNDFGLIDYYKDVFCEVVLSSDYEINESIYGAFCTEKEWRPFLMCAIPMIITFINYDKYLKDAGFDMFDDVIDTSFYKTDDLDRKFNIIKSNFKIIESDLIIDGKFRDDIWTRLKLNQERFINGWENYFYGKIND